MKAIFIGLRSAVAAAALLSALLLAAPAQFAGCGGGDEKPGDKKPGDKKPGDKGTKPADKPKPGDEKNMLEIEEIKDRIKTKVEPMLTEGASVAEILSVKEMLDEGEKKIQGLGGDKTTDAGNWNKLRDKVMDMLLAEPLMKIAQDEVDKKPEDFGGAISKYEELIKYLDKAKGDTVKKTVASLKSEIKVIESIREWTKKLPSDEMDLLAGGMTGWDNWGREKDNVKVSVKGGEMTVDFASGKDYGYLTARHAFWRNYDAEIEFTIEAGEIIIVHRHIPSNRSMPFQSSIGGEGWTGTKKELKFEMVDSTLKVTDPEGEQIDMLTGDMPGGGITFKLKPGTKLTVHKLVVKKR